MPLSLMRSQYVVQGNQTPFLRIHRSCGGPAAAKMNPWISAPVPGSLPHLLHLSHWMCRKEKLIFMLEVVTLERALVPTASQGVWRTRQAPVPRPQPGGP